MHLTHALVSHASLGFFRGLAALEEASLALTLSISVILGALALGYVPPVPELAGYPGHSHSNVPTLC